ncbi:g8536 [Coccomyxa viridis]|uniref:G8536 protein n=1 Tax=Coccomyxa viridis TaxID=1274662 RepID=A0ABP1G5D2_9CHLO
MQMSEIKVSILHPVEGRGAYTIQSHRKRDAASVISALRKVYGPGISKDPEGKQISSDPEIQLRVGPHTYTLVRRALPWQRCDDGLAGSLYRTMRADTCEKLYKNLEYTGYYIMEGAPGMGKASLLQCLLEWAANNHPDMHTVYINLQREKGDFQLNDVLQAHLGCPLDDIIWGGDEPLLLCLDEVQLAYDVEKTGSAKSWTQMRSLEWGRWTLKVSMMAASGYTPPAGVVSHD